MKWRQVGDGHGPGNSLAFASSPDLHLAAHEAHIVHPRRRSVISGSVPRSPGSIATRARHHGGQDELELEDREVHPDAHARPMRDEGRCKFLRCRRAP